VLITLGALWLDLWPILSAVVTTAGGVADACTDLIATCLTCACESGRCTGPVSTAIGVGAAGGAAGGFGSSSGGDDGVGDTSEPPPSGDDTLPPGNEDLEC
jgi:hypothetical protein